MAQLMVHRNILKTFHKLPSKVQKRVSELISEFQEDPHSPAYRYACIVGNDVGPKGQGYSEISRRLPSNRDRAR